jgi:hypothetical protein
MEFWQENIYEPHGFALDAHCWAMFLSWHH